MLIAKTLEDFIKLVLGLWGDTASDRGNYESYSIEDFCGNNVDKVDIEYIKLYDNYLSEYSDYGYKNHIKPTDHVFYRGQSDAGFDLIPSIFRKGQLSHEEEYYHELIVRCPQYFNSVSHVDRLVTMQHYGTYTRLLDITSNPLVALYFACLKTKNDADGKVFVFTLSRNSVRYFDSDKVMMLSCIPAFNQYQQDKMRKCQTANCGRS